MASTTNAALFGDSDSSDESVGAAKVAAPASDPAPANDNDNDSEGDDDANGDKTGANSASNANLFGDDDSSDDDEFDGDDGIVGRSAAGDGNKGTLEAEAVVAKPQTMSERLGEYCTHLVCHVYETHASAPVSHRFFRLLSFAFVATPSFFRCISYS